MAGSCYVAQMWTHRTRYVCVCANDFNVFQTVSPLHAFICGSVLRHYVFSCVFLVSKVLQWYTVNIHIEYKGRTPHSCDENCIHAPSDPATIDKFCAQCSIWTLRVKWRTYPRPTRAVYFVCACVRTIIMSSIVCCSVNFPRCRAMDVCDSARRDEGKKQQRAPYIIINSFTWKRNNMKIISLFVVGSVDFNRVHFYWNCFFLRAHRRDVICER